jgi:Family of unknown function (DUF6236)
VPGSSLIPRMAVYYPYIHIRDERWLKVAALYWPRLVRIVSPDYPTRNSQLVDILAGELDFIIDHSPEDAAQHVAASFTEFIEGLGAEALLHLRVEQDGERPGPERLMLPRPPATFSSAHGGLDVTSCIPAFENYTPGWADAWHFAGIHHSEIAASLAGRLIDARLATRAGGGEWLAMDPGLAWLYKCRLTEELARRNNLAPATDQPPAHAVIGGPVDITSYADQVATEIESPDFQARFGLLSIEAVIPRNLDQVPPVKIVEIRRKFRAQFDRWRDYADELAVQLAAQLHEIEAPDLVQAYLDDAVRRYATGPADDLRRGLAAAGVETATTAINTKFGVPAAALAGLAAPQIAAAGGMALAVANLRQSAHRHAQALHGAPAAYLLSIQETLTPRTWLSQILSTMRRAAGLRD